MRRLLAALGIGGAGVLHYLHHKYQQQERRKRESRCAFLARVTAPVLDRHQWPDTDATELGDWRNRAA